MVKRAFDKCVMIVRFYLRKRTVFIFNNIQKVSVPNPFYYFVIFYFPLNKKRNYIIMKKSIV